MDGRSAACPSADRRPPDAFSPVGHRLQPAPSDAESAMMDRFRTEYLDLLDARLSAIRACVADERWEDARIAVLSLESSSGMLGERAIMQRLHEFRDQLETATPAHRLAMIAMIEAEAERVRQRAS